MSKSLITRLAVATVLVAGGCAAPSSGESTPSPTASTSATPSVSPNSPAPTSIAPSNPPSKPAEPDPGEGPWPPDLIFSDLKEAGAVEVITDGVRIQLPAGFTQQPGSEAGTTQWAGTGPGASGPGSVSIASTSPTGQDAIAMLDGYQPQLTRAGAVDVPGAASAALGELIVSGVQTWVLVVLTPQGTAVTAEFTAAVADFETLLLVQSVSSAKVPA